MPPSQISVTAPLAGLKVAEAADSIAIRHAGQLLAALGAEVVQTGAPRDADIGYGGEAGRAYAAWLDRGKLTRATPASLDQFDLVLTDRAAGPSDGPGPLVVTVSWFGEQGPYAGWQATDGTIQALTGAAYPFGEAAGAPTVAQGNGPSLIAGVTACIAALAALRARRAGSGPSRIDVSVLEAAMCITEHAAISHAATPLPSPRLGVNRFVPTYPCTAYRASDGWVGMTALTPAQWRGLCTLIGADELARDPRYTTTEMRLAAADAVDAAIAGRFLGRTSDEWAAAGQALRIPMTPIRRPGDVPADPQWRARQSFAPLPGFERAQGPRIPFLPTPGAVRSRAADTREAGPHKPLAGLRVLDFSMGWSGPLAARHLADLGADIVKVESVDYPDWWRGWEARSDEDPPAYETRPPFNAVNRNKKGITLDLRSEEGRAAARALAANSDVLIQNFTTGVMEGFGLGADMLQTISPGIVSISMGAFGASGPLAGYRAYGSTVEQASSLALINGREEWAPCLQHVAYGDAVAGLYAAFAVLAYLYDPDAAAGASIDLSQVECLFQFAAPAIIAEQVTGTRVARTGSVRPTGFLSGVFGCTGDDEWIYVEMRDDLRREALERIAGAGDAAGLPDRLAAWASAKRPDEAVAALQAEGIAAAAIRRPSLLESDPQLAAAGFWTRAQRRHVGEHLLAGAPYLLDGKRPATTRPAPLLGQHTDEVLEALGRDFMQDEEA